jgi:hypothetical protein
MARKRDFFKHASLTLAQQIGRMSATYPYFRVSFNYSAVVWVGDLQPSGMSETYTVRVEYILRKRPKVYVIQPPLGSRDAIHGIPHTFPDGSICLHLHEDWTPQMFIAETIIPWFTLWLFHYEVWLATGEWLGGGHGSGVEE